MAKKTYNPLKLPSGDSELKSYVVKNKIQLMEQVIDAIEFCLSNDLTVVEVFSFTSSGFIVTLNSESFRENVECIYDFYISSENYELCPRVKRINMKLKKYEK